MIYRNFSAPPRAFTQLSHEIIRHPRLSSDAVRLLTWQLSLPQGARESLSRTAERARIGGCAFTRAKRQLKEEGFVHERRVQGAGGLWVTQQLVSSVPLSAAEAVKILSGVPAPTSTERVSPQVAPGPRTPAAGEPATPPTDGHPKKDPEQDTSHPPTPAVEPTEPAELTELTALTAPSQPAEQALPDEARALVAAFPHLSPALRHVPPGMRVELTRLTARWLAAGHTSADIHAHVLRGLPGDGTPVHHPGGLLRYLLREVPPVSPPTPPEPSERAPGPGLSARLARARECAGEHIQPMLFRPLGDETLCGLCTSG
ncbi:hypothetical protein J7E93_29460 [Streptomyces sp. ISL-36]|uniref:hypothetical protein n=1 Tax=Streptomyces sp. ISL-36 TaxID=2819182 RepID=UPI001BE7217A|nr:hypothetical protein [Streptomyces sp. ISL-36]MBT2444145.1 hypothetical protein [Streptomyces sp. ISL-36]